MMVMITIMMMMIMDDLERSWMMMYDDGCMIDGEDDNGDHSDDGDDG